MARRVEEPLPRTAKRSILLAIGLLWAGVAAASDETRVAILEFEGPRGIGEELADAVELELELEDGIVLVPRKRVASKLRRGDARTSPASIREALRRGKADLVVFGIWEEDLDGAELRVTGFNRQGAEVFTEPLTLTSDEPDVEMLAGMIAGSIAEATAGGLEAIPSEPEDRRPAEPLPDGPDELDDPGLDDGLPDGDDRKRGDRRDVATSDRDQRSSRRLDDDDDSSSDRFDDATADRSPRRRMLLTDDDDEDERRDELRERVGDIDEETEAGGASALRGDLPYVEVSAAFEPLYWSYFVDGTVWTSEVPWSLGSPFVGGSVRAEAWPILYAGLDAQARAGMVEVNLEGIPGLDQRAIEIIFYELQLHARGRYVFDKPLPGLAVGGRLGYRFLMANAAAQSPFTVVPGFAAHILAPGLDVRVPLHKQYAILDLSVEGIPFALYEEFPDSPGEPGTAGTLGWRVDARFHSVLFFGVFAELRMFYEEYYVSYTGTGNRINDRGQAYLDGKVTTGMRGLSVGVGWSY